MGYEVRISALASRDLRLIYQEKSVETSPPAASWFLGLRDTIFSLETMPARGPVTREDATLHHLLYGNKPHVYRIVYAIDEPAKIVNIVQVRHRAQRPL